jgi:hypothetical protein
VLKDSLDETSNIALIVCISPSVDSYKETFSTLQFADRAKKAILDGRNFSDSRLLKQSSMGRSSHEKQTLLQAYREEKALREQLHFQNQDEFISEFKRLK